MKTKLMLVLVVLLAGCWNSDVNNPVSPEYPCGTRGLVCSTDPLSCCWQHQYCGAKGTRCPEDMCCFDGDRASRDGGADGGSEPTKQWTP